MSNVTHLIRQIRALPFNDMMLIAEELRARIGELTEQKIEAVVLAGILTRLSAGVGEMPDPVKEDEAVLKDIFRVKRQLIIQKHGKGWQIDVPTVPGAQVVGQNLREMFSMMLDQIITLHVLKK